MSELLTQIYILGRMSDGYTGGDVSVLLLCLICMLEENYIGQGPGTPNHVCCYRNRMCKGKSWIICQKGDVNERKQLRISADKRIKTMAHTTDHMLWGPSKSGILPSMSRYPKAASETQHLSLCDHCAWYPRADRVKYPQKVFSIYACFDRIHLDAHRWTCWFSALFSMYKIELYLCFFVCKYRLYFLVVGFQNIIQADCVIVVMRKRG